MRTAVREGAFHLRLLLRNAYFVQTALIAPLVLVALRVQAGRGGPALWADGVVVGVWSATATAVGILGYQRMQGVLEQIALTPRPIGTALAPISIACTAVGVLSLPAAVLGAGLLDGWTAPHSPALVALGLVLLAAACATTALALSGLVVLTRHATVYEPILLAPVLLLSGAVIKHAQLPVPLQLLGVLDPLTGAVQVLHAGISGGLAPGAVAVWSAQGLLAALVSALVARAILRVAVRRARSAGTLALS
ncbi:ABC transporter permease [Rathayibacter sp. VKM Ac-2856]|uniref:ABC transporter permease n=1 Tax=unclassified Rathayibacter TaxID=2609250 RepID=UPI0015658C8E|nr:MULTISPECIES: ABC transporter permease [unclassified Rathayibacter]NQX05395.1 ABC transporter permease [Rathayibacter sp. VKM Ac-2858]NQX20730.1 ABC transporter permease [Rathayibacter sp. VKM Ac-2856]